MKSISYIILLIRKGHFGVLLASLALLTGCAGVPITKTNCWSTGTSTVTTSTKGASPVLGKVDDATRCH